MVSSRTGTAAVGVAVSLAVSIAAWVYYDTFLVFLVVPFVPFLFRRRRHERLSTKRCPVCGFQTSEPTFDHCPRDGTVLE